MQDVKKICCPFIGKLLNGIHIVKCPRCGEHTWNGKPIYTLKEIAERFHIRYPHIPTTETPRVIPLDTKDQTPYEFLSVVSSSGKTYGLLKRYGEYHIMAYENRRWSVK